MHQIRSVLWMRKIRPCEGGGGDSDALDKLVPIRAGFKSTVATQTGTKTAIRSLVERPSRRVNSARGAQRRESQHAQ